jgi:hypothetical protein
VMRLVMLWIALGLWVVPVLWLFRLWADANTWTWTGNATEIFWEKDEDMAQASNWCSSAISLFFKHNA